MSRFFLMISCVSLMMFNTDLAKAANFGLPGYQYKNTGTPVLEQGTDGHLLRVQGRGYGSARGSFVHSCKNTQQDGWTIRSMCKDVQGRWSWTSINFRHCPGFYVENLNGNLVCEDR